MSIIIHKIVFIEQRMIKNAQPITRVVANVG